MNRTQRRNMAKMIVKSQPLPKIRLRYSNKLEEYKQMPLEDLQGMLETKISRTDRLALEDAIKFKTESDDNSGDSTTDNN
jgi:hypothetical protein